MENLKVELESKRLDELRTIARARGVKGIYNTKKSILISKIIASSKDSELKLSQNSRKPVPFYKKWWFSISITLTAALVFFLISKNATSEVKGEVIKIQKLHKTDEEYSEYIEQQEELNIELLRNFFGDDFQVFGQRNNHLFKNAELFETKLFVLNDTLTIELLGSGISTKASKNITVRGEFSVPVYLLKKGKPHIFDIIGLDGKLFALVPLNDNQYNPVYAFGLIGV